MNRIPPALCLLVCLACPLAACSSAQPEAFPSPAPVRETPSPVPDSAPQQAADSEPESHLVFSRSAGTQTADGFYTVHLYDDWTGCLVFYDYASRQAVPVCTQPNCEHHDDTCPAWFGENIPRLLTNGEQLVFCYLNSPARLETADMDGGNRRVLYEFAPNETPGDGFCMDETSVYLLSTRVDDGQAGSQDLLRIALEDGSCESLRSSSLAGGTYSFLTGCRGPELVIKEIRRNTAQSDTAEQLADQTHTLLLVNPRSGSTTPLYSWQQGDALESALENALYCLTADHRLCSFAGDGQLTELARDDRFIPSVTQVQYADDTTLWFTAPETGTEGTSGLYQLTLADGIITPVPLSRGRSLTVLGEYGDQLLVRLAEDDSLQASLNTRYALIAKSQLVAADAEKALAEFTELF